MGPAGPSKRNQWNCLFTLVKNVYNSEYMHMYGLASNCVGAWTVKLGFYKMYCLLATMYCEP